MAHNGISASSNVGNSATAPSQVSGRGRNFSAVEERQLCLSFLHVSQDPIIGNGQKATKFWLRIEKHFNERRPIGSDNRPARSLESKWSAIKHDMSKFVASYQAVVALNESGLSEQDRIDRALQLYKQGHPKGHSFTFVESWKILRDIPKWTDLGDKSLKLNKSTTKHSGQGILGDITNSPVLAPKDCTPPENSYGVKRPQGTKFAKAELKKTRAQDVALHEQVKASKSMAEASQLKATLNLFAMDISIQDALGREYIQLRKQAELNKLKKELWKMGEVIDEAPSHVRAAGEGPSFSSADIVEGDIVAKRTSLPDQPTNDEDECPNMDNVWSGDTDIISTDEE